MIVRTELIYHKIIELITINPVVISVRKCLVVIEQNWKVNELTVLKPDISLICNESNLAHISKSPLIVVEIISKSTAKRDEQYKFEIYKEERVSYYVLVYPNDLKAKIYKLEENNYIKEGDFSLETYDFKDLECQVTINFESVFEKFRK